MPQKIFTMDTTAAKNDCCPQEKKNKDNQTPKAAERVHCQKITKQH